MQKSERYTNIAPLHSCITGHNQHVLKYPSCRNQENSHRHCETQFVRGPNTTRAPELVRCHYQKNYFFSKNYIIFQNYGLAVGAPSFGIITEIFLQHAENLHLACLAQRHSIINYFRFVDDILLIFYPNLTDKQAIPTDCNVLHPKLHFTAETEVNNTLKYFDISIHRTPTGFRTSTYRKPTFIDIVIPYTSNHPTQHKYAAIKIPIQQTQLRRSTKGRVPTRSWRHSQHPV